MNTRLVPKYGSEVEHTLSILNLMISERKDEMDKEIDSSPSLKFLYSVHHKRKAYYANDTKIKQLRDEVSRIESLALPESYHWED